MPSGTCRKFRGNPGVIALALLPLFAVMPVLIGVIPSHSLQYDTLGHSPDLTIRRAMGNAAFGGQREGIPRALDRDPARDAATDASAFRCTPPLSS